MITHLPWDSEFFGIKTGRIVILDEQDFNAETFRQQAIAGQYSLVYLFTFDHLLSPAIIGTAGISLADIMITMSRPLDREIIKKVPYDFRTQLSGDELQQCYQIAENTAGVSRFCNEKLIGPEKARALYRKWIDNALDQTFADGILILKESDRIAGIHVVKTDTSAKTGHCSMIAVHPDFQGKGYGRTLWDHALSYWSDKKTIEHCTVPFSLQNHESFNFHLKMGFNIVEEIKYIYHYRKNV